MHSEQKIYVAYILCRIAEENHNLAKGVESAKEMLDSLYLDLYLETGINKSAHSNETLREWASDWTI